MRLSLSLLEGSRQGRSQPHSPGWARVPLSSFFLKFRSIFLIFPQTLLIFFLILALRVGKSPPREGPGYATLSKPPNKPSITENTQITHWKIDVLTQTNNIWNVA